MFKILRTRLFTAIELPQYVHDRLAEAQTALNRQIAGKVSWTKPENLHLTLKFLGEVADAELPRLCDALKTFRGSPISLAISRLGVLPPRGPTRVLMAELDGQLDRLSRLFDDIERACEPLGFAREKRRYRPHVTLARVRQPRKLTDQIQSAEPVTTDPFVASEFVLMQSLLHPSGSKYQALARFGE